MKKTILIATTSALVLLAGCRQDMQDQPKYRGLRASNFFADGRSARMPVAGTVARGQLKEDTYFETGKINGVEGDKLPMPLTMDLMKRGQNRFNIYCAPCHSRVGDGRGMVAQRMPLEAKKPASYLDDKLKKAPIGHFYVVMTEGFGAMLNYSAQINSKDRWAIAAYVRALQLSQDARTSDVPAGTKIEPPIGTVSSEKPKTEPGKKEG